MNDSDKNIMMSLAHEACEGHCHDCERCIPYPLQPHEDGCCDDCRDINRCACPTCTEDRAERPL